MFVGEVSLCEARPDTMATIGLDPDVKVKAERQDDDEINEMAERMKETHKAKMLAASAAAARVLPPVNSGQGGILNYLTRKTVPEPLPESKSTPVDDASWKGHFGWEVIGKCHVPYIYRYGEKWVCVRMAETKLLCKHLAALHPELYSCTYIRSFYVNELEARLLNEINSRHCDYQFGRDAFTVRDLIVRLSETIQFFHFLEMCYNRVFRGIPTKDKCGFIRINKESVVPYTVRDGQKYVPLFYFEGETDNLKQKSDQLKGWDLVYLKFCCKVQGIRNELFASETCSVISLTDIKSYFPVGTHFEEYWPNKIADTHLLINPKKSGQNPASGGQWTRAPSAPPSVASSNNGHTMHPANTTISTSRSRRTNNNTNSRQAATNQAALTATVHALSSGWPLPSLPSQLTQQQTQVLRLAQAQVQAQAVVRYNLGMSHRSTQQQQQQQQQQQRTLQQQYTNGALNGLSITQQPQQPPPLLRNNMSSMNGHSEAGRSTKRLSAIPEIALTGNVSPYKVQKALVEKMMVPCINWKPYLYQELLMTIPDLATHYFPRVPLADVRAMLDALGITLYRPNSTQLQVLRAAGKCKSASEGVALIHVGDVMSHMPQFLYMQHAHETPPPAHSHHSALSHSHHSHALSHTPLAHVQHTQHSQHSGPPPKRARAN